MKLQLSKLLIIPIIALAVALFSANWNCSSTRIAEAFPTDTLYTNSNNMGWDIELTFLRGQAHNHPLMAVWIEDTNHNYLETLYVAESIAKGTFDHGNSSSGKWLPGAIRRPAALPVWSHSRNIQEVDGLYIPTEKTPMPDAVSGATPQNNFILRTKTKVKSPSKLLIFFEINQTWDWNEYWTNNKYPDDDDYKSSCQPALVYSAKIDISEESKVYNLNLIGHSHYSGKDGRIYDDISTISTALDITKSITVKITKN